ncbi:MAG: NusG domain II-containing protein [Clostridia bacterium]|nr:NusG domain II-containing protein [Clostridia bacterium]MDY5264668.1 NusG domain II-containing protein [Eubacteriales bacterium]MDY5439395.1 NusG domain II-containing protein [Eubacteriales bacterium]
MKKYDNTNNVINLKESGYFKKADIAIALVVLLAFVGLIVLLCMPQGDKVVIRVDGEVKYTYSLRQDRVISIDYNGEKNANVIVIKNGAVYVKSATCKNHDCVDMGKISKTGEVITCLPHKLMVEIVGKNAKVDTVI